MCIFNCFNDDDSNIINTCLRYNNNNNNINRNMIIRNFCKRKHFDQGPVLEMFVHSMRICNFHIKLYVFIVCM